MLKAYVGTAGAKPLKPSWAGIAATASLSQAGSKP
jgi:hypothetical protein